VEFVADVIDDTTLTWKEEQVRAIVSEEEEETILSIPISQSGRMDYLVWHPNPNGIYSVKTGYHLAVDEQASTLTPQASSSFQPPREVWKFIWNLNVPPKLRHFWWKACCNLLATKENLHRRKCSPSPLCTICNQEKESTEHLFFRCGWTLATWFGNNLTYKVDTEAISSVMKWTIAIMESLNSAKEGRDLMSRCVSLCWQIWKARHEWVFRSVPVDPHAVLEKAAFNWREFQASREGQNGSEIREGFMKTNLTDSWNPPPVGSVKINCDVALVKGSNQAAIAAILRDHRGRILDGRTSKIKASSPLQGEALAIRLAGSMLLPTYHNLASIESDNQRIIKLCSTENVPPWDCATIIEDIRALSRLALCSFSWAPRNCNRAAHWIASHCLKGTLSPDWVSNPPPSLSSICNCDASF